MLELFATTHCEKRTISLLSRVPIFTCPKMGVVNTQIQTETTFITAKPEKWLTFFVVVAEIVFICMDTSHVKRKIDSQNFVIFSDTNTPLLYLQKDYMLTGIYLYIMLLWRLNCIVFFCCFFAKLCIFQLCSLAPAPRAWCPQILARVGIANNNN